MIVRCKKIKEEICNYLISYLIPNPLGQSLLLFVSCHLPSIFCTTAFDLSTSPCDCGCRGRPLMIVKSGQSDLRSNITCALKYFVY